MGREVKRVPMDFEWPLKTIWNGYLMPEELHSVPCPCCEGTGHNKATLEISNNFYAFSDPTKRWCDNLTQDEVQALVDKDRLWDLTHTWTPSRGYRMGMFDYLRCEMPLPDKAPKELEWQTKDLECGLEWYAIRENGQLVNRHIRRELKPGAPEAPKEWLSEEYFEWAGTWWEPKEGPDEPADFTGAINFYTMDKATKQWWEFCAFIEDGHCFKIVQIEPTPEMQQAPRQTEERSKAER